MYDNKIQYANKRTGRRNYDFVVAENPKDDSRHNLIVIADPQISDRDELPDLDKHAEDIGQYAQGIKDSYTFGEIPLHDSHG